MWDVDGEDQQFFDWHVNTIASRQQPNDLDHTQKLRPILHRRLLERLARQAMQCRVPSDVLYQFQKVDPFLD